MTRPTRKAPAGVSVPSLARRIRMRFAPLSLAICLAMCLPPARVFAQTDIWSGGAGLWSNASMWSTGVPTSSSNVFIDNGNPVASTVTLNYNGAQCGNLTIDSNDSLVMVDGTIFTLYGPTISNSGNISLESAGAGLDFNFGGAVTLTGAGTVTMSNNSANAIMGYAQPSPGASLTNKSTIQGAEALPRPVEIASSTRRRSTPIRRPR